MIQLEYQLPHFVNYKESLLVIQQNNVRLTGKKSLSYSIQIKASYSSQEEGFTKSIIYL